MTEELKADSKCKGCNKFDVKKGFKVCERCYRITMLKIDNTLKEARYKDNFDCEE